MTCICCRSNKITHWPSRLAGYYLCRDCGLIFATKCKENGNSDRIINHYQKFDPHERVADSKQQFFNTALNFLSRYYNNKKSILDVGCGYGYFLDAAKNRGWQISGVEVVEIAAINANKKLGGKYIYCGYLRDANYPDNSFDVVTLWDILFIFEDPHKELIECFRIMREGGKIGIRVRNVFFQKCLYRVYSPFRRIGSRLGIQNPSVFHRYCFSSKSIYKLLHGVGFRNIKIYNSVLTEGDPYKYTGIKILTWIVKKMAYLMAMVVFRISGGKWVIGSSLLIWAEKPR